MLKWVTLPEYKKMTGLSRETFLILVGTGEVTAVRTEGGQWRIKVEESPELLELRDEIVGLNSKLDILCSHLGVQM